jgi:hypothetical protein
MNVAPILQLPQPYSTPTVMLSIITKTTDMMHGWRGDRGDSVTWVF